MNPLCGPDTPSPPAGGRAKKKSAGAAGVARVATGYAGGRPRPRRRVLEHEYREERVHFAKNQSFSEVTLMATPTASTDESARWHWSEGMKFALEGIKLLFLLNGASAVSILTFIGNMKVGTHWLVIAMVMFAVGSAMPVISMIYAYLTQLHYGNASFACWEDYRSYQNATSNHVITYLFIALGMLAFIAGVVLAGIGFWHMPQPRAVLPISTLHY